MRLSVIVITHNEAANIVECLSTVSFADECIVVDSGSDDDTVALARRAGARVAVMADWPGFGPQKNRALAMAQGDWVLSIDADERLTPELGRELQDRLAEDDSAVVAYTLPRLSSFCGKFIRHSGWWPDPVVRLFRNGRGRFTDARVHEKVMVDGAVRDLSQPLLHYTYPDLDTALQKMNRYSSDAAQVMYERGKRATLATAIGHGLWTFIRIYGLRRGFLDGGHGLMLALVAAMGSFSRYAKLMLLHKQLPPQPPYKGS